VGVELAALIVEAVGQFVPDHHADAAEVHRVVHLL
jgi:hypothetical protein